MGLRSFFIIFAPKLIKCMKLVRRTLQDMIDHYKGNYAKSYFWRTTQQQEIDYIEECDGAFTAFEMKWNPKKASVSVPSPFKNGYALRQFVVVTPANYLEWTV